MYLVFVPNHFSFSGKRMCKDSSYLVIGKVQKVMFRQTIIRAMLKHNIRGGASNCKECKSHVYMTISGEENCQRSFLEALVPGKAINSWGALPHTIVKLPDPKYLIPKEMEARLHDWQLHKVTTANVDSFSWNTNVTMFI